MNIYDIADLAGVSIATVSRVLNSGKVSESTKQKVLKIISEYQYVPSTYARAMTMSSAKLVGIILTEIDDLYAANAVANFESRLKQRGYDIIIFSTGKYIADASNYINSLVSKKADAVILVGSKFESAEFASILEPVSLEVPIIMLNSYVDRKGVYCVVSDDESAVSEIVDLLISREFRKLFYLYDSDSPSGTRKLEGFRRAASVFKDVEYQIVKCDKDIATARRIVTGLVRDSRSRQAVICSDDLLAVGAIKAAQDLKLSIPEDISVTGYDNSILSLSTTPELTTVDCMLGELCSKSIDLMMDVLSGKTIKRKHVLKCKLIERKSTR